MKRPMPDTSSAKRLFTRRHFLSASAAGAASFGLSACVNVPNTPATTSYAPEPLPGPIQYQSMYSAVIDSGYDIPAVPIDKIDLRYLRQEVANLTGQRPGTMVVDTGNHFLYLTLERGRAMRYGVGLGRAGFAWSGNGEIKVKRPWPRWFPPNEMIDRQPELEKYRAEYDKANNAWLGGMQPGPSNPLGARALYIYQNGKDTLYRVHGSPEWWTIGKSVSSGCVRMINQDVIDLYNRVPDGTPIVVTSGLAVV